jgi:hypothetical protein
LLPAFWFIFVCFCCLPLSLPLLFANALPLLPPLQPLSLPLFLLLTLLHLFPCLVVMFKILLWGGGGW